MSVYDRLRTLPTIHEPQSETSAHMRGWARILSQTRVGFGHRPDLVMHSDLLRRHILDEANQDHEDCTADGAAADIANPALDGLPGDGAH